MIPPARDIPVKKWLAIVCTLAILCSMGMLSGCSKTGLPETAGTSSETVEILATADNETDDVPPVEEQAVDTEKTTTPIADTEAGMESAAESATDAETGTGTESDSSDEVTIDSAVETSVFSIASVPAYSESAYVAVNENTPYFSASDLSTASYEYYSSLDSLGRCGVAVACVGQDMLPTTVRGSIGQVKPSGWHTVKYDCVDGEYLYNRCHLIGYQLSGENANEKNLITGTRYLNMEGMLPFENMVVDYVKETGNHVLYRVTPVFEGNNLLATGVLMEAESVEDCGDGILYCVFCYNAQPGITIDYATGDSSLEDGTTETADETELTTAAATDYSQFKYVLNTSSKKVHFPSCSSAGTIDEAHKQGSNASSDELIAQGYAPCGKCHPFEMPATKPTVP